MREKDRRLLLRAIAGELGPEERARLDDRLGAEPELRAAEDRLVRIHALVRETPRAEFRPGFAGRVMARVTAEAPRRLQTSLGIHFRRLAPAALALILGLLAHNLLTGGAQAQSPVEAALGLKPVTLDIAFGFDPATYQAVGEAAPSPGEAAP
jgi:anti-sigma factor RsiW